MRGQFPRLMVRRSGHGTEGEERVAEPVAEPAPAPDPFPESRPAGLSTADPSALPFVATLPSAMATAAVATDAASIDAGLPVVVMVGGAMANQNHPSMNAVSTSLPNNAFSKRGWTLLPSTRPCCRYWR